MDNQTKENKDQKFRQWAESIQQTKDRQPSKSVRRPEDETPVPTKKAAPVERPPVPTRPVPPVVEKEIPEEEDWDDDNEDFEEREESKTREIRENRKRRQKPDVEAVLPKPRKKGKTALLVGITFLLAFAVIVCLVLVMGNKNLANKISEKSEVEIAAEPSPDSRDEQEISLTVDTGVEAQPSGITLSVPDEYALYGRTEYISMTQEEYDQLLSGVRQYIDVQLKALTKLKDPYYPHFDAVSANDDCTVYTITVNEAGARSQKENAIPEQLSFFTRMYAAYSQQNVQQFEIDYQAANGTVLKKDTISLAAGASDLAAPAATVPDMTNNSTEIQSQPGTPIPNDAANNDTAVNTTAPAMTVPTAVTPAAEVSDMANNSTEVQGQPGAPLSN